jgi:hypothetical protein
MGQMMRTTLRLDVLTLCLIVFAPEFANAQYQHGARVLKEALWI